MILELQRTLPADRPTVFAALSEPAELRQWWGPEGFTIPSVEFEARPGAAYRIEMQPPAGDSFFLTGEVHEVDPPARLTYTFAWEPPDPDDVETLVELTVGDGTVGLRQGSFKTEERLELHRGGWTESFDKLERLLAQRRV